MRPWSGGTGSLGCEGKWRGAAVQLLSQQAPPPSPASAPSPCQEPAGAPCPGRPGVGDGPESRGRAGALRGGGQPQMRAASRATELGGASPSLLTARQEGTLGQPRVVPLQGHHQGQQGSSVVQGVSGPQRAPWLPPPCSVPTPATTQPDLTRPAPRPPAPDCPRCGASH